MDLVIYTGFGYGGRDLLLVRSSDALICGCGRIGTIHNFTTALEENKPIGIFEGPWEMGDQLKDIVAKSHKGNPTIIATDDPKKMIKDLISFINTNKVGEYKL